MNPEGGVLDEKKRSPTILHPILIVIADWWALGVGFELVLAGGRRTSQNGANTQNVRKPDDSHTPRILSVAKPSCIVMAKLNADLASNSVRANLNQTFQER